MKKLYSFYRIFDNAENYVGVTSQPINIRMARHYSRAFTEMHQSKMYKYFRASPQMFCQVFDQEVLTEEDARIKEMLYIKMLQPSLNTHHAS